MVVDSGGGGVQRGGRADILDRLIHAKLCSTHGSLNCVMKHRELSNFLF